MIRYIPLTILCGLLAVGVAPAWSEPSASAAPYVVSAAPRADAISDNDITAASFHENRVEISLQSGQLFDVGLSGEFYHVAPQFFTIHWQLDEVGNEGWRRGNTEWLFTGYFTPVIDGIESQQAGVMWGPRYNFVQEDWRWVPYIESRVGVGFTDSRADQKKSGQGQDFFFTFTVGVGAKYLISDHANIGLGLMYQHISNAGLSEPERINYGLDTLGPVLSFAYGF